MIRATVVLEITIIALFALFVIYQLIVPVLMGTPLLPILRKQRRDALDELRSANADLEASQIRDETRYVKERAFPVAGANVEPKAKKKINK